MIPDWFFSLVSRKHLQLPEPKSRLRNTSIPQPSQESKTTCSHKHRGDIKVLQILHPTRGTTKAQIQQVHPPLSGNFHLKQESTEEQTYKALSVSVLIVQQMSKQHTLSLKKENSEEITKKPFHWVSAASPRLCALLLICFCHPTSHL